MADHDVEGFVTGAPVTKISAGRRGLAFDSLRGPAAWLAIFFVGATVLFWRFHITAAWEPPYLNMILQITLVSSISLIVAALAARSFLRSGSWPLLWLGAGSLTYGLAVAFSNSLLQLANINAAVTTHNLNVLLVAQLHLLGAFFVYNGISRQENSVGRLVSVLQVCIASVFMVLLVTAGALVGLLPPFFVQGQGGTPWRQMVVVAAALLFSLDGLAFLIQYRRSRAGFLYWYALGLLLNALVMASTLLTTAIGSPLSWLARGAQILGGLYLLVATLATVNEARARQLSPEDVLASFFWRDEANLRLLFDSITDAIIVTDRRFVITDWNEAAEDAYGWKAEEVAGKPVTDVLHTSYPSGTGREAASEALLSAGAWKGEVRQVRCDGAELTVLATVSTLKGAAGRVVGAVAVNRDITERKRMEDQLRTSEEKTRDLIRYAPTGIYEVNFHTGRFRNVNDAMCEILGYTREELLAMSAFDLLDDASKALFADRIRRTLAGEKVDPSVEYRVIKKDGTPIYGVLNTRITYTSGQPDGAFVIAHDVTERRRAAEELRLAAETLERRVLERTTELAQTNAELARSREEMQELSHRLIEAVENERRTIARELHDQANQLLTSLMLGLSILEKRYHGSEGASGHIAYLRGIGDDLARCMHDLAVSLRPASLDRVGLVPALQQLAELFRSQAHLEIDLVITGLHERLGGDVETAVYRIVQESLTNIVRHANATKVGIVVQRQGDHVTAIIEDDGKGFHSEEAWNSGRLGLTGMRERAEMLGGTLAIETEPGKGTTVFAELPCPRPEG